MLGLSFALIPLLIGIAAKSQASLMSGLLVAAIASWSTPFIMEAVEGAYERYEDGPRISYLDADIEVWLHIHEERAET